MLEAILVELLAVLHLRVDSEPCSNIRIDRKWLVVTNAQLTMVKKSQKIRNMKEGN
jgi:hypothetical protein